MIDDYREVLDDQVMDQLDRCHRRVDGLIYTARATGVRRLDNGPEFVAETVRWIEAVGAKTVYIDRLAMGEWIL